MFLGNVDIAVTNTATPAIQAGLGASGGELELIVSGYTLAYAMLLVTTARLGQARGYRRIYLYGLSVFTVASTVCGLAPTALILVLARIAQGVGAAMLTSQVLSGIQLHFTGTARRRALGWYSAVLAGSAVIGQVVGGLLISADLFGTSWRPVFLVNVPLGVALLVMAARALPADEPHGAASVDLPGVAALSGALLLVVVPLVLAPGSGWPTWTWLALAAAVVCCTIFVLIERRAAVVGRHPLIDLALLRRPAIAWGLLTAVTSTSTYFALLFVLALYLQQGLGASPALSGLALVPWVAAFGVAGPVLGRASERRTRVAAPAGALILTGAFAGIAVSLLTGATSTVPLVILLGLGGLGFGAVFSGTLGNLTGAVTGRHAPDISGLFNTASRIGGVVGVAAFGTVYLSLAPGGGRTASIHSFSVTTVALAGTALAAGLCASLAALRHPSR